MTNKKLFFIIALSGETNLKWIALYTRARHEFSVARQIQKMGYETYVPKQTELHQWSDRKRFVEVPLIPSYVFIKIPLKFYYKVYDAHGIVRIVMFNGRIAIISDEEIDMVKKVEKCNEVKLVSTREFEDGNEVEIVDGKFIGFRGRVLNIRNGNEVGIIVEELGMTLIVNKGKIKQIQKQELIKV